MTSQSSGLPHIPNMFLAPIQISPISWQCLDTPDDRAGIPIGNTMIPKIDDCQGVKDPGPNPNLPFPRRTSFLLPAIPQASRSAPKCRVLLTNSRRDALPSSRCTAVHLVLDYCCEGGTPERIEFDRVDSISAGRAAEPIL